MELILPHDQTTDPLTSTSPFSLVNVGQGALLLYEAENLRPVLYSDDEEEEEGDRGKEDDGYGGLFGGGGGGMRAADGKALFGWAVMWCSFCF